MTSVVPPYDFSRKPEVTDFTYHLGSFGDGFAPEVLQEVVEPALAESEQRFGIHTTILEPWAIPDTDGRPAHVLVGPVNSLDPSRSQRAYLHQLATMGNRVNVISAIPLDDPHMAQSDQIVPKQDALLGVNTIYPDSVTGEFKTPSARDITDNQVCETMRVKYSAEQVTTLRHKRWLELAQKAASHGFDWMSQLYAELGLYHRAPSDGAVVIRTDYGWLTTQTKTDKTAMSVANTSLILPGGDRDAIQYVGAKLPTSDAPELLTMVDELSRAYAILPTGPKVVAHFHDNQVVRGGEFEHMMGSQVLEYGVAASGLIMAADLIKILDNDPQAGLIVPEHGVVWAGRSVAEFTQFLSNALGKLIPEALV